MSKWIEHDSNDPPALAPAALVEWVMAGPSALGWVDDTEVGLATWKPGDHYRQRRDPDGIPYCSADGLRESTKYVTTAENGAVFQWVMKPRLGLGSPGYWVGVSHALCDGDHRHPGDWRESLMRVWRE